MSNVTAAALRELHRLHSQLADLRGRLERGPKQIAAHRGSVAKLQAAAAAAHEQVKQARLAADGKQLDIKAQEERIQGWNAQLNAASSNKEYQTLQDQIAAAQMAASVLEDETLELLGRIDDLILAAGKADQNVEAGKAELAKVEGNVNATAETLRAEVTRLEADLAEAEKVLPADFKVDYQRVVNNKGADGLAPADDGVCQGCGQKITLNMQNELAMSKPVFCKSCGCLLYLSE